MVGVPSHFKIWIFLLVLISSCAKKSHPYIESRGVTIDESSYVDAVTVDSISFASGTTIWLLQGMIVSKGEEFPFQSVYPNNPVRENSQPMYVMAPECFGVASQDSIATVLTQSNSEITLSWKTEDRYLMIRSVLTSER